MSKGQLVAIGMGVFALICLVLTYDFSRGRIPETKSPVVADVLAAASGRDCGRDATETVLLHIPLGTEQPEAERRMNSIEIVPPARMPSPPAAAVAAVSSGPDTQPMPVCTIGYRTPVSSVTRVLIGVAPPARAGPAGR